LSDPLVSIVILTRNGAGILPATLAAIGRQRTDFPFEIVGVDSGSTDGTPALVERAGGKVTRIEPGWFNHGLTRNFAIERARGELIVLLVQDAIPASDDWLEALTTPLRSHPEVAGAFCRQQPRPGATALTRHYLERWVGASPAARSANLTDAAAFSRLQPAERLELCTFDNVCSCIRRSVWRQIPFAETPIGEDLEWAKAVLLAGFRLEYVANAAVLHSHDRSAGYELARTYVLHHRLYSLFGLRTIGSLGGLARAIAGSMRLHLRCEREAGASAGIKAGTARAVALAVAWPLGQYLGGLSASRGWKPIRISSV
jgi:rhamnosyltransferase